MKPVVKLFADGHPFPISMNYKDTKQPQSELPDHIHDWHEIIYVYRGKGTMFIDHSFYDMACGDLFLIPGNTIHRAFPDKNEPVTSTALFFQPSILPADSYGEAFSFRQLFARSETVSYKLSLPEEAARQIVGTIDAIKEEMEQLGHGYRHVISARLQLALLAVSRLVPAERHTAPGDQHAARPDWFARALELIDRDAAGSSNLTELAARCSVSPEHLSRQFKQLTGMTFKTYVTAKKLIKAKELLAATDHKVAAIAHECGFDSLPHFHRTFKRFTGFAPAVYRQSASGR